MAQAVIRTFLDSSVLIAAYHADRPLSERANKILNDAGRVFLASTLIEMELTQPQFNARYRAEADYYLEYLRNFVSERIDITEDLLEKGLDTIRSTQAAALDAMHLTCAVEMGADELITAERSGNPIYREKRIPVRYLGEL